MKRILRLDQRRMLPKGTALQAAVVALPVAASPEATTKAHHLIVQQAKALPLQIRTFKKIPLRLRNRLRRGSRQLSFIALLESQENKNADPPLWSAQR